MLGHWKDFQELEDSLSMPELNAILVESRRQVAEERKFTAALQVSILMLVLQKMLLGVFKNVLKKW